MKVFSVEVVLLLVHLVVLALFIESTRDLFSDTVRWLAKEIVPVLATVITPVIGLTVPLELASEVEQALVIMVGLKFTTDAASWLATACFTGTDLQDHVELRCDVMIAHDRGVEVDWDNEILVQLSVVLKIINCVCLVSWNLECMSSFVHLEF